MTHLPLGGAGRARHGQRGGRLRPGAPRYGGVGVGGRRRGARGGGPLCGGLPGQRPVAFFFPFLFFMLEVGGVLVPASGVCACRRVAVALRSREESTDAGALRDAPADRFPVWIAPRPCVRARLPV